MVVKSMCAAGWIGGTTAVAFNVTTYYPLGGALIASTTEVNVKIKS